MRIPRDISGNELAKKLTSLGYEVTRQKGSHMRLTTLNRGEHHVTIPSHNPLRVGTLRAVLSSVAEHAGLSLNELVQQLFEKHR